MATRVGTENVQAEQGYLYCVGKDGYVQAVPMRHQKGKLQRKTVGTEKIQKKPGHMYFVKGGCVYEAPLKHAKVVG